MSATKRSPTHSLSPPASCSKGPTSAALLSMKQLVTAIMSGPLTQASRMLRPFSPVPPQNMFDELQSPASSGGGRTTIAWECTGQPDLLARCRMRCVTTSTGIDTSEGLLRSNFDKTEMTAAEGLSEAGPSTAKAPPTQRLLLLKALTERPTPPAV